MCTSLWKTQGGIKARAREKARESDRESYCSPGKQNSTVCFWVNAGCSDESREEGERKHHPQSTLFLLDAQKENILASPHKQENRKSTDNDSVSGTAYIPESTDNNKKSPFILRLLLERSCVLNWIVCCSEYHMYSITQNNRNILN